MANTIPISVRLQKAINQPSLILRCQETTQILQEVSSKDAGYILRIVIESIFGASEENLGNMQLQPNITIDWGLRIITLSEHRLEFDTMRSFLSPKGPLLNLIYKLACDPFQLLLFPIALLPNKVKNEIQDGNAGAFYTNKIQNLGPGKNPVNIMLNAFEFYIFHFGNFLLSNNAQRWNFFWTSVRDCLYPTLLEDYLSAFLPCDGSMPPGPQSHPVSPRGILAPVIQRIPVSPPASGSSSAFHNLSILVSPIARPFRSPEACGNLSYVDSGAHTSSPLHSHSIQPEINMWTSHSVIQVLMEIWINLCVPPPKIGGGHFVAQTSSFHPLNDVFVPSSDHVRAVRMLFKHFHYFSNSIKANQNSPLDPLRRNIWPMCRKSVYFFLKHLFTHWPLDSSFRLVLETWLSFIQPWRYLSYTQLERTPKKQLNEMDHSHVIESKWKMFMAENLLFYSHLFDLFLKRILRLDLASPKNAQILFRVAKVFSQQNVNAMLHDIETLLETNQKSFLGLAGGGAATPSSPLAAPTEGDENAPAPQTILHAVRNHIVDLEKQNYHHRSVFGDVIPKDVYRLLKVAKTAQDSVAAELHLSAGIVHASKRSEGAFEWFSWLWKSIFDSPQVRDDENTADELQRCHTHLELSINYLCNIFNILQPDVSLLTLTTDQSSSESHLMGGAFGAEKSHLPEQKLTEGGGFVLTNLGRYQMLNGMRRTDFKYDGDPDLKPICTFEVAFLVRIFYAFTKFFNDKYEAEIIGLYYRRDFLGAISRVVLSPPETVFEYKKGGGDPPYRRVAKDIPPRLRLRTMASKKVLLSIFVLYLFLSTVGISYYGAIIPLIVAYVVCKAAIQRNRQPSFLIGGVSFSSN